MLLHASFHGILMAFHLIKRPFNIFSKSHTQPHPYKYHLLYKIYTVTEQYETKTNENERR